MMALSRTFPRVPRPGFAAVSAAAVIGESEAIRTMQTRNNGGARLVVTSASGANGNGCGALLAFDRAGAPLGAFSTRLPLNGAST